MIDWITAIVPCTQLKPISGGRFMKIAPSGEILLEVDTGLDLGGSHDSNLKVKTATHQSGEATHIYFSGNPTKWLQGHNIFGTDDLRGLVIDTMSRLVDLLHIEPTDLDIASWHAGHYYLKRVDVNYSYELNSRRDVRSWLRAAEYSAYMRHRGRGQLTKNGTLYFAQTSRRSSIKMYSKGDEIQAPGHKLSDTLKCPDLIAWADNKLRVEVVLRSLELKDRHLDLAANWEQNIASKLHREFMEKLKMTDQVILNSKSLEGLPARLQAVYKLWLQGEDLRALYPLRTFYRYRADLLLHQIDIAIRQPHQDRSNVVPLMRILEAVPAPIPAWAYGTDLYYEPIIRRQA